MVDRKFRAGNQSGGRGERTKEGGGGGRRETDLKDT